MHDPAQAAQIIGQTAQLELYDLTPSLYGPSIDASAEPGPVARASSTCSTRVQSGQKGAPVGVLPVPLARQEADRRAREHAGGAEARPGRDRAQARARRRRSPSRPRPRRATGEDDHARRPAGQDDARLPDRLPGAHRPERVTVVITCDVVDRRRLPGQLDTTNPTPPPASPTTTSSSTAIYPRDSNEPVPADDGQGPEAVGHAGRHRSEHGPADRDDAVQGQGQQALPRDHAARGSARRSQLGRNESFAIVLDDQLYSFPTIDYKQYGDGIDPTGGGAQITGLASQKEAKNLALVLQTGALPVHVRHGRALRRLGDARQGLAPPGAQRRDRRPDPRRALPARPLPLPRRRRGLRSRDLLGADVRRDPAPQRHADAAGLRRPDPHDRRRRRRERRHLRTHQGGGARRASGARGDLDRLREGLPDDRRRERRHGDHGAGPVRGRDRAR